MFSFNTNVFPDLSNVQPYTNYEDFVCVSSQPERNTGCPVPHPEQMKERGQGAEAGYFLRHFILTLWLNMEIQANLLHFPTSVFIMRCVLKILGFDSFILHLAIYITNCKKAKEGEKLKVHSIFFCIYLFQTGFCCSSIHQFVSPPVHLFVC